MQDNSSGGGKSALVCIDLQNDMVHPRGAYGAGGFAEVVARRNILETVASLQAACRVANTVVCHVRLGYRPDYADCLSRSPRVAILKERKAVILGEWGAEVHETVAPAAGERVFVKQSVNAFWNTQLHSWLWSSGISRVVLAGVATHLAIESAARFADDAGFEVVIIEDCCAAPNIEIHEFCFKHTLPLFGQIISAKDYIALHCDRRSS